jgi:phosphoglycolate phosphatase-like HAD superfamily hydrolase
MPNPSLVVYVDIDDTLVRSVGHKRIPMPAVVAHVKELAREGAVLYCWSSAGGDYARRTAEELGIIDCFTAFLPKPNVLIDDQNLADWAQTLEVHPQSIGGKSSNEYLRTLQAKHRP